MIQIRTNGWKDRSEALVSEGHRIVTFDNDFVTTAKEAFDCFDNLANNDIMEVIAKMKIFQNKFNKILKRGY